MKEKVKEMIKEITKGNMKGLAICHKGIEDITALEVKELIGKESLIEDRAVIFDATLDELAKVTYMARSVKRVVLLLGEIKISENFKKTAQRLNGLVKQIDIKEWLDGKSFKVECKRVSIKISHDFTSQQIEEKVGELLLKKQKTKVALSNPDTVVYVFINDNELYVGIDFAGIDLSKRDYKIFSTASALNGAVAYALVRIAKLKQKETMLDPFCGCGTIPIEAALYLKNMSVNYFRKDKLVFTKFIKTPPKDETKQDFKVIAYDQQINLMKATKKNAQIAGVHKDIEVSKIDIEWLDTKLEKHSIDKIITQPPFPSKTLDTKKAEKLYKEFFYQADYILADKGIIAVILEKDELFKKCMDKLKIAEEREIMQGKKLMKVLVLKRG